MSKWATPNLSQDQEREAVPVALKGTSPGLKGGVYTSMFVITDKARVIFKERVNRVAFIKADTKVSTFLARGPCQGSHGHARPCTVLPR